MKEQFCYQGKYFDNEKDFWKYVEEWPKKMITLEDAGRLMDHLKNDMMLNLFNMMGMEGMTNGDLRRILEGMLFEFYEKLNERE